MHRLPFQFQQLALRSKSAASTVHGQKCQDPIKEEHVDWSEYVDCHEASRQIGRFLDEVSLRRHSPFLARLSHAGSGDSLLSVTFVYRVLGAVHYGVSLKGYPSG